MVAAIFNPLQFFMRGISRQLRASKTQQGSRETASVKPLDRWHGGQTLHAGSAQQLQQQGLGLVIGLMGREQHLAGCDMPREAGISCVPCRGLQAMFADLRNLYAFKDNRDIQLLTILP